MDAMINLEKQCPGYYDSISNIAPFHPRLETHVPMSTAAPQAISKAHDNRVSRLPDPKRINRPPTPVVNQEKPIFLEPIREVAESENRDPRITQFKYVKQRSVVDLQLSPAVIVLVWVMHLVRTVLLHLWSK